MSGMVAEILFSRKNGEANEKDEKLKEMEELKARQNRVERRVGALEKQVAVIQRVQQKRG